MINERVAAKSGKVHFEEAPSLLNIYDSMVFKLCTQALSLWSRATHFVLPHLVHVAYHLRRQFTLVFLIASIIARFAFPVCHRVRYSSRKCARSLELTPSV